MEQQEADAWLEKELAELNALGLEPDLRHFMGVAAILESYRCRGLTYERSKELLRLLYGGKK